MNSIYPALAFDSLFGLPDRDGFLPSDTKAHQGDQIRGFGFLHDGATDTLLNFLRGGVFDNGGAGCEPGTSSAHGCEFNQGQVGIPDEATRESLVNYLMEFDSDIAPIGKATLKQQALADSNACVVPGNGYRYVLDANGDGVYNRD